ncbi:MAG: diaminopimelate epimerase [Magnetospiraceae bacterium]
MENGLSFRKMNGLGNDFVIVDNRARPRAINAALVRSVADRRTGVGCDQFIVLESPRDSLADVFMRIHNHDGQEVEACGNAARCVASLMLAETGKKQVILETVVGLLDAEAAASGEIAVDMGQARLDWRDIPVKEAVDTLHLNVTEGPLTDPVGVNMGNPHAVFFVDDAETVDLRRWGPLIETHPYFPERANVEVVQVISNARLRMRVWERGVGITRACGTGACAALVAAARRKLTGRSAEVILDGGILQIEWLPDNNVLMTGPVATAFSGIIDPTLLA